MAFCSCGHSHLVVRNPDEMPWSRIGGSFIALMTPGSSVLSRIGNPSAFSKRCKRCPGVGAIRLKKGELTVPLTVNRRVRSRHGSAGSEDALRAFLIYDPDGPRCSAQLVCILRVRGGGGQHVAEPEAVALHFFTGYDWYPPAERFSLKHGSRIDKGMELAVFTARIGGWGKITQK